MFIISYPEWDRKGEVRIIPVMRKKKKMKKEKAVKTYEAKKPKITRLNGYRENLEDAIRMVSADIELSVKLADKAIDDSIDNGDSNYASSLILLKEIYLAIDRLIKSGQLVIDIANCDYPLIYLHSIMNSVKDSKYEA